MDAVGQFLKDISPAPRFTKAEEAALAVRMRAGDQEARRLLIHSVLPWAVNLAKRYRGRRAVVDVISDACLTATRVVDRLDEKKGRLTTLVAIAFRRDVIRYEAKDCAITTPMSPTRYFPEIARAKRAQSLPLGNRPTDSCTTMVLSDPSLIDGETPDAACELVERSEQCLAALRELPERLVIVILGRFWGQLTLQQLGTILGISRERVRQLQARGVRELRRRMVAEGVE